MNLQKIIYWVATAIMIAIFSLSAFMYFTKFEMVSGFYTELGFPHWMIYPLAIAKVLAMVAILTNVSKFLTEWAYAGLFFDVCMAITAHLMVGHGVGGANLSIIAFFAIIISRALLQYRSAPAR